MKHIAILCCLLSACTFTHSQPISLNQGGPSTSKYYTELPYEMVNGKMFVQVSIKGKQHKFLFDTGAPVAVSPKLLAELQLTEIHKGDFTDVTGATTSGSAVKLDSIKLGDVTFTGIPAITLFPDWYNCFGIDGVIGSNILRQSAVKLVSDKHLIIITDQPNKLVLNKKHSVPLITNANKNQQSDPQIKILLNNKVSLTLGFDTGDNGFLRFSDDLMQQLAKYKSYDVASKGFGATTIGEIGLQASADKYLLKIPFINIGSARFDNLVTETNKGGIPGIGTKLLDYGDVTLDFINGKFYFDAKNDANAPDNKQWPFQPTFADGKLIVGLVWQKGMGKVKPGEQIMAVDGKDLSNLTLCQLMDGGPILGDKQTAVVTLKATDGQERKLKIDKE
ncbi:MAG: retropepsin-like aspartic protease [Mucilaginibacter sp.]|uniref:aspartyl protease family protein n=1 Tax=Mucilaginibacter sp. TaxID=1882438 RepID=UPI00356872E8